jgi:hypothetical protein
VNAVRAALVVVIVFNFALLAAAGPLQATLVRYEAARKQQELRRLDLEQKTLLHRAAQARRPDEVARRAAALGLELQTLDSNAIVGTDAPRKPVAQAPRR